MSEAIAFCILGILLFPAFLHVSNLLADLNGKFARIMLGQTDYMASSENNTSVAENETTDFTESNIIASQDNNAHQSLS